MSDTFDGWDGTDGTDAWTDDALTAQPEPTPDAVEGPPDAAPRDPHVQALLTDPLGAVEVIRHYAQHETDSAVADAIERWESGEEDPDVIADELRDRHGYDLAARFVQHWHAEDAEYADPPPVPETAVEWVIREQQRLDYLRSLEQAEQAQRAQEQQAQLDAEIHQAFNEGVKETRARHASLSRGKTRITSEQLFPIINHLGATANPRTPEEARQTGEQLYRQAVELVRAMNEAELVASFETPQDRALRLGYMPGAAEIEERRNALSPEDERLNRFVNAVDVSRTAPRPTLAESLHAEFDADEARTRWFEQQFQLSDGATRTDAKKSSQPRASTVADGWHV